MEMALTTSVCEGGIPDPQTAEGRTAAGTAGSSDLVHAKCGATRSVAQWYGKQKEYHSTPYMGPSGGRTSLVVATGPPGEASDSRPEVVVQCGPLNARARIPGSSALISRAVSAWRRFKARTSPWSASSSASIRTCCGS